MLRKCAVAAALAATLSVAAIAEESARPPAAAPGTEPSAAAPGATAVATARRDDDPAPAAAAPDPLTPERTDEGPLRAPGAPAETRPADTRPAEAPQADARATPVSLEVGLTRARLDGWGEGRDAAEKADLAALKAYYAATGAGMLWLGPDGPTPRAIAALAALGRADAFGLDPASLAAPPLPASGADPEARAEAEVRIGLAVLRYARHARGGRLDPPSLSRMIDMRPRLFEPRSVIEAIAAAPAADAWLEGLHPRHAGFAALKQHLANARAEGNGDGERRIIVNMERWRWLPDDLGAFHVWDNVPEQLTRVLHDGRVVLKERIVVGKPNTPTPMFSAPMRFVIFHPSWGVPDGIKSNELGPMLRRAQASGSGWLFGDGDAASRALRRHELRVYRGGREINPDSVNWAAVDMRQFHFTQPPSGRNVLGVVKFRFPNRFDVYMHDTSERHLFSRGQRTFSHGCMRVENPLRLAEVILAYDKGWGGERIKALVARGSTTDVTLDKAVPVHIVYFTATVDERGRLAMHPDIYGQDARLASALTGRSVTLASAAPARDAEPRNEARARKEARKARAASAGEAGAPRERFDPFSSLSAN